MGKPVTKDWVNQQYKKHGEHVLVGNGVFYHCQRSSYADAPVVMPKVGWTQEGSPFVINQVFNKDEALATLVDAGTAHLKGLDTTKYLEGSVFQGITVYVGPYKYKSTTGAERTVRGYQICTLVTKEQFIEALSSGFELYEYVTIHGDGLIEYTTTTKPVAPPK
jgi:hypothetical protein